MSYRLNRKVRGALIGPPEGNDQAETIEEFQNSNSTALMQSKKGAAGEGRPKEINDNESYSPTGGNTQEHSR
jgi:hypothetical protein